MQPIFADRLSAMPKSFVQEILKVAGDPETISFAGGLPNPAFFPSAELAQAAFKVLSEDGQSALQYSTTEGYLPLRQYIADRYLQKKGLKISPDEILITNGSQQGMDLLSKVLLNRGDLVVIERPSFLGAIQAFSVYEPSFESVPLREDGIDVEALRDVFARRRPKMVYLIPNFQNPTGISYSRETRQAVAGLLGGSDTILVEDDPYGELRFRGEDQPSMKSYLGDTAVLLGTFSKTVAPGLRLGWICAAPELMERLVAVKQAEDIHSSYVLQMILHRYLLDNDLDRHVEGIRRAYGARCELMLSAIAESCPAVVRCTRPEGGMFLWMTLPAGASARRLLEIAARDKVCFVPGGAFHVDGGGDDALRLNFTNCDEERIRAGVDRLGRAIETMCRGEAAVRA